MSTSDTLMHEVIAEKPDDFISLPPMNERNPTVRQDIKNTLRRFHDQEFTIRDLMNVIEALPRYKNRGGIYETVTRDFRRNHEKWGVSRLPGRSDNYARHIFMNTAFINKE